MGEVLPVPTHGEVFTDVRGDGRTMRVSCHADQGIVVVSLWAGPQCRASFRLSIDDLPLLLSALGMMAQTGSPPQVEPVADAPEQTGAAEESAGTANITWLPVVRPQVA